MKDIKIKINKETRDVVANKFFIGNDGENLQGNIIFSFDEFVNGQARLEYEIDGIKNYQILQKDELTYKIPIKNTITKEGKIGMQLIVTEGTSENEIPKFKSNIFYLQCNKSINAEIEQPDEYNSWIEIANAKLNKIDEAIVESDTATEYATEQGNYAKETGDNLNSKLEKGEFDGATFVPNLDEEGNLSWSNNKNLENPQTQNIRGPQGVMGPQGEAFKIKKTYSSKDEMLADFENMEIGDYVMITSNIEVEDNAKLYSKGETEWIFITDFSGATGIQGPQGPQGIQGIQGPIGPKGEKPVKGVDYFTEAEQNEMIAEITDNANSVFNQNVTEKTNEFNTNAETKVNEFNETVDSLQEEIDDLYNNQMFNEVSGESIHLTDSANAKVDYLEIEGNSYQETTTGANILNNTSYSVGSINGNDGQNEVSESTYRFDEYSEIKSNTQIYLLKALCIYYYDENKNFISSDITGALSFTTPTNAKYARFRTFSADFNSFNLDDYMVSYSAITSYEPYTGGVASPNPDYPQEVKVVEGYNLFTLDNVTDVGMGQGITLNKIDNNNFDLVTEGKSGWQAIAVVFDLLSNTDYTLSYNQTNSLEGQTNWLNIAGYDESTGKYSDIINITATENIVRTFNTGKYTKIRTNFYAKTSATLLGANTAKVRNVKLEKGSEVKPYLPYGKIGIKVVGKNLLDLKFYESVSDYYLVSNGDITLLKADTRANNIIDVNNCLSLSAGTYTYITKNSMERCLCQNRLTGETIFDVKNVTYHTFTLEEETLLYFKLLSPSNNFPQTIQKPMILEGTYTTEQEYEPYKEKMTYIDLKGNFVGKLSTGTKDRLYIQDKHLYLEKKVGKVVLDGSDDEQWWSQGGIQYRKPLNNSKSYGKMLSDYFINSENQTNGNMNIYADGYLRIYKESTDLNDFLTWLSENNVTIYYELAEPQIIDLGYIKTPKTLEKTSNISLLAKSETNMSLKYVQHTKTILENMQNQINNIMTAIIPENEEVE